MEVWRTRHESTCNGAGKGELFDTFIPERITRYTLRIFGPLILLGFLLLGARWWVFPLGSALAERFQIGRRRQVQLDDQPARS